MSFKVNFSISFSLFLLLSLGLSTPIYGGQRYLTAQIGTFGLIAEKNMNNLSDFSDTGPGFMSRLGLGYAKEFNTKFRYGIESGVNYNQINFDTSVPRLYLYDISMGQIERVSIDLLAVFYYNITSRASLFLKMGPGFAHVTEKWDESTVCNDYGCVFINNSTSTGFFPKVVLGFGYDITRKINLNLSLNREFKTSRVPNLGSFSLGVNYTFC